MVASASAAPLPDPSSHIAVDLSQRTTAQALESLSKMTKRMSKIRSARVFTSRAGVGIHPQISPQDMIHIFRVLGQMPNLTSAVVDLSRPRHYTGNGGLPLNALIQLLKTRLQSLQLRQLDVTLTTTNPNDGQAAWKELCRCLAKHKHLQKMSITNCVGKNICCLVGVVVKHARSLRRFQLVGTTISPPALVRLTSKQYHPYLQSIQLEDVPDLDDDQVSRLCNGLEKQDCQLQELHLRSSILTEAAGDRLALMLCLNTSLHTVHFHLDCERFANSMAHCLGINSTLRNVDLRCYGDDEAVSHNVVQIALALQHSPIQRLRLCLEIEPLDFQQDILDAFGFLLVGDNTTNTSLQELVLDDGIQTYPLSEELQLQLELNRCGYSRYIRTEEDGGSGVTTQEWMQVLHAASQVGNLSVLYTTLSNCPTLICGADRVPGEEQKSAMDGSSSKMDASSKRRRYHGILSSVVSSTTKRTASSSPISNRRKFALPSRTGSGSKSLRKRVIGILVPSAA